MKTGTPPFLRPSISLAVAGILVAVLAACTGRGGGYLPPDPGIPPDTGFADRASFGFSFSCEDKGGINPPTGQMHIQLSYTDQGTNPLGSAFSIHGIVDEIPPVMESMICSGQVQPPEPLPPNHLIFLGRYWVTSSVPETLQACPTRETETMCRFEVQVKDNDSDHAPSKGDFFSIQLSSSSVLDDELEPGTVVYTRAGFLEGGNLTVD